MSRTVPGILPYTLLKINDVPTLVFLLWRDRKTTSLESSTFWGQGKEDNSPLDAVCRVFSEKTKGQFAPNTLIFDSEHEADLVARKQSPLKQKITESRLALRKKIVAGSGVTLLSIAQFVTYVTPVRFVAPAQLKEAFGNEKGEAQWVEAKDLFGALYSSDPDNLVTVRARPYNSATSQAPFPVVLPLSLPFTVSMRTQSAKEELSAILKQFNVPLPEPTSTASTKAAAGSTDMPAMAKLSLKERKPTESAASASATSTTASSSSSSASSSSSSSDSASAKPSYLYSCRKCRNLLFTDLDLSRSHALAQSRYAGRFTGKHVRANEGARRAHSECSSYFIERMTALGNPDDFAEDEGSLQCQKCKTRFGNYVWSGAQCSCGEWITPAFQAVKSKVDERPLQVDRSSHVAFRFQRPPPRNSPPPTAAAPAPATTTATAASASSQPAQPATPASSTASPPSTAVDGSTPTPASELLAAPEASASVSDPSAVQG